MKKIFSRITGKPEHQIEMDTDRNNFMNAWEAMVYGLVDVVIDDGKLGLVAPIADVSPPPRPSLSKLLRIDGRKSGHTNIPSQERLLQQGSDEGRGMETDSGAPHPGLSADSGDFIRMYSEVHETFDLMGLMVNLSGSIHAYGFEKPSAIQQRGIVPFCEGHDRIQQAQSGILEGQQHFASISLSSLTMV
ncbi:hypothetical protein LguiA_033592 [Lonicera macranthoides]